ncbi:TPA: hypothetical protein VDV84_004892 [Pseudomonas aeruginosa]|jgi:ribonuclease T2|uniref:Possible ribonuclease n=1 Tax=Pseudomonas aeruginosa (strain UCBPP-PA14) TaxID=208963 RepID=A0A0H2Z8S7_PSEAB|nr:MULTISPECIES: ribonuclease [Pseudomonas]SAJ22736.1 Ribonuclease I [Enterobacter cloacae]ABJ10562.1 possible ribonuclease [Pseudomonas aeruginosa UCBPP-PA14]ALY71107.1 ribonuclease [Pseudomonas aeruginosa]ALY80534.1 ribonuclease [Pseudomonas aeruginosa]ASM86644.1 ribonuclease [Pseudomonas aeruginosa]
MIRVPQFLLGFVMAHMVFVAHAAPSCILPEKAESGYDYNTNRDSYGKNDSATTDYYKLAINWSGAHCAEKAKEIENLKKKGKFEAAETVRNRNAFQCFSNNKFGWILHGLWAQTCNGKNWEDCRDWKAIQTHPRLCRGDLPAVDYEEIKSHLCQSPGAALLQGEWEKHGACNFASASEYFSRQGQLFADLSLPESRLPDKELLQWLKEKNPSLADKEIQIDGNEFYVCYDVNFTPMSCPPLE